MRRFYVNKDNIESNFIYIDGSDVNHIKNVLRMDIGDKIEICDCNNFLYNGNIIELNKDSVKIKIQNKYKDNTEPDIQLTVLQCIPKSKKMTGVIQKCVELGVHNIVPVISNRCISRPKNKKVNRWNKVAEQAAKQCKRGILPQVTRIIDFKEAVQYSLDYDIKIICYEMEKSQSLHDINFTGKNVKKIAVIVGPEGGLQQDEVDYARENGFFPVSLGKRILRTETAAPTVSSIIMYNINEI